MTREIALHCMKSYSELHSDLCELCPIYGQTGNDHCFEDALQYVIEMLEQEPTGSNNLSSGTRKNSKKLESISTTKENLGVDWDELKRKILMDVDGGTDDAWLAYGDVCDNISKSIDDFKADLPSVTPQEPILDKVRSEIESKLDNINRLYNQDNQYDDGAIDSLQYALDIIDKYSECEGKK
jgi:hypothetical protein